MDLESYISRYSGETRLQRLLLIAQTTPDEAMAAQAFDMAEEQMRQDGNVKRYKEIFGYQNHLQQQQQQQQQSASEEPVQDTDTTNVFMQPPPNHHHRYDYHPLKMRLPSKPYDKDWVEETEASNRNARHVLQGRLSTAQSHLHKEAIRTAYIALAQHDTKAGNLREALSSLLFACDFCTTRNQTAHISLLILELAFAMQQYGQVKEYVSKLEHTLGASSSSSAGGGGGSGGGGGNALSSSPASASCMGGGGGGGLQDIPTKLVIASGLEQLAQGEYASAASIFTKLTMSTSSANLEWPGVVSAEDIALYTSLLSLATRDRAAILELSEHPEALELVPKMKDLLSQWSRAKYSTCMMAFSDSSLSSSSTGMSHDSIVPVGDLYLSGSRYQELSQKIREKCLVEYLKPYQRVHISSMNQLFPSLQHNLEDMLVSLIGRGLIPNARLDSRANVLFKTPPKSLVDLQPMEQRVMDDTHAMLIRLACLEYDLFVQDNTPRGRSRSGGAATAVSAAHHRHHRHSNDGDDDDDDDDDSSDEEGDTPMLDAGLVNSAINPEDLY